MVDLSVTLSGVKFQNPIIPASGTFGFGEAFEPFYDLNILGSFSMKGTTREARFGNEVPRIAECAAGMLNAVGLQNPGVDAVIREELPRLSKTFRQPLVANISGFSIDEYIYCCERFGACAQVGIIEVNISCPNVKHGGLSFGSTAKAAAEVVKALRPVTKKPLYIKLSPNVTDIAEIAQACEGAGADGLSLVNTLVGMRIDIRTQRPILKNVTGGYSGPAVFPVALRMVHQVAGSVRIPVIGMGGITCAEDVIEMMLAGASAVQIGTQNLINPYACKEIIEALPVLMEKLGFERISDIVGRVQYE